MKKLSKMLSLLLLLSFFAATGCKKADTGPAGTNGVDGNANVKVFLFKNTTTLDGPIDTLSADSVTINTKLPLTLASMDTTLILAYYQIVASSNFWYPAPGIGYQKTYETRFYTGQVDSNVVANLDILNVGGAAYTGNPLPISKLKFIVIPASQVTINKRAAVDFNDYKATMAYFHLAE